MKIHNAPVPKNHHWGKQIRSYSLTIEGHLQTQEKIMEDMNEMTTKSETHTQLH